AIISEVVLDIAKYCNQHAFYLNEELVVHCCCAYMGAEDVVRLKPSQREDAICNVRELVKSAKHMIRQEAGLERIDKFFGTVTKAKLSGPIIERFRELSAHLH